MKWYRFLVVAVALIATNSLSAQQSDTTAVAAKADTTAVAAKADTTVVAAKIDSLPAKVDTLPKKRHTPIASVRTLGTVAPIDTLPTTSDELQIILYNDNTWRYVRTKPSQRDQKIFSEYWNTSVTHVYYGISADKLPESIPIQLIDSLSGSHYPYKGWMSSKYGPRGGRGHQGVDLPLKTGDPVYAAFDGKVRYSNFSSSGYGNLIIIRHHNGLETYYAHLSERSVQAGEWVVAGQQIGKGGSTGRSSGPHLHFETRYKGQSFDPERLFDFKTGELRQAELLLKRRHFSINSKYEQDFNDEEIANQLAAKEKSAAAAKSAAAKSTSTKSSSSKPTTSVSVTKSTSSKSSSSATYHTIEEGDMFSSLAIKYKTTSKRIQELNPDVDPTKLQIGQKIRVK